MDKESKPKRLGRGLSALLGDERPVLDAPPVEPGARPAQQLPVAYLRPNPKQPRRHFDEDRLSELAASIGEKGMLQPILVRPIAGEEDAYEIVAGERRWRAAQKAQVHDVPVIVRDLSDGDVLEIAIIENIQRADLTPIEEASAYQALVTEFGYTQDQVAQTVSKSRSHVANMMRLLNLPESVQDMLRDGALTAGHARAILSVDNPVALARQIIEEGLTVRATEALAKSHGGGGRGGATKPAPVASMSDPDTRALQDNLAAALGLNVSIRHKGEGGAVTIEYASLEQLDAICQRLCQTGRSNVA